MVQAGAVNVTLDGFHAKNTDELAHEIEAIHIEDGESSATSPS